MFEEDGGAPMVEQMTGDPSVAVKLFSDAAGINLFMKSSSYLRLSISTLVGPEMLLMSVMFDPIVDETCAKLLLSF